MSAFNALKTHTVTVARFASENNDGDPTYGTQKEIRVRIRTRGFRDQKYGRMLDVFSKILTDEWEFEKSDAVWMPGADTSSAAAAINPRIVMTHTTMGITVSSAEF